MRLPIAILFSICLSVSAQTFTRSLAFLGNANARGSGSTPDVTRGLVAWWKLDEGSGSVSADTMGNYQGTNINIGYVTGQVGPYAATFNSTSSQIDVPSFNVTNITISCWVYPTNSAANAGVFTKYASGNYSYYLRLEGRIPFFYVNIGGSAAGFDLAPKAIALSNWTHIVAMANGTGISVWTNGVFHCIAAAVGNIQSSTSQIEMGTLATQFYGGWMDNVRVYNCGLTPAEIYTISASTNLPSTNTVSGWNFVAEGDSMTDATTLPGTNTINWPNYLNTNQLNSVLSVKNLAVSGQAFFSSPGTQAILNDQKPIARCYSPNASTNILFLWCSNDIKLGANNDSAWARVKQAIQIGTSLGYKVGVATIIPRSDYNSTMNGYKTNLNTTILNSAAAAGATWVVDLRTNALLDYVAHPENFNADTIHPNNIGMKVIATNVQAIVFP